MTNKDYIHLMGLHLSGMYDMLEFLDDGKGQQTWNQLYKKAGRDTVFITIGDRLRMEARGEQ